MNQHRKGYSAAYHAAHREEEKAYSAAYHAAHREEEKAYSAAYRVARREEVKAYRAARREEENAYSAAYYAAHREEKRARHISRKFDISLRDAELLIILRDGEGAWCDICRTTDAHRFNIDHDHNTGKIRGIICSNCNGFLGKLENDSLMQAVHDYLAPEAAR